MSELIDIVKLTALAEKAKRPPQIVLEDGSQRIALYNDEKNCYEIQPEPATIPRQQRSVADIVSLADLVLAEANRVGPETYSVADGTFMTAAFNDAGGFVYLREDRGPRGPVIVFRRQQSFSLKRLIEAVVGYRKHDEFILLLSNLAPWMQDAKAVLAAYRKISVETTAGLVSAPYLDEDGTKGESWKCSVKVTQGGPQQTASLPASLKFTMPFSLRSPSQYDVEANVDIGGSQDQGTGRYRPLFRLICPSLAAVQEKAIEDELAFFAEAVKERLPKLVIVREG